MSKEIIDRAIELFEDNYYEASVEMLIDAYNSGVEQEWILSFFYQNFIIPNEEEYQHNYSENAKEIINLRYEDCNIDFIPVSDEKYYLFHRDEKMFLGSIVLGQDTTTEKKSIHSLLIADAWDLRDMIPFIRQKQYQMVYILLEKNVKEFASFLKLKNILNDYLNNVLIFSSMDVLKEFFLEYTTFYLPHDICSLRGDYYAESIRDLRKERVKNVKKSRESVFLSICIPSFNRGHRALECVQRLQTLDYDAEIEILISDNGSKENVEGYRQIANLQQIDSRVKYVAMPENKMFYGNICNLVANASGEFIMFASDEDLPILEKMEDCLEYIYSHQECGAGTFSHLGVNGIEVEEEYIDDEYGRMISALNANYLTGLVLNRMELVNQNAVTVLERYIDNQYIWHYTHCAFALMAVKNRNVFVSDIVLWKEGKEEKEHENIEGVFLPSSRLQQGVDALNYIKETIIPSDTVWIDLIHERIWKAYFLVGLAFYYYGSNENQYSLFEACIELYSGWDSYIKEESLNEDTKVKLCNKNKEYFWEKLLQNPLCKYMSDEEKTIFAITISILQYLDKGGCDVASISLRDVEQSWIDAVKKIC